MKRLPAWPVLLLLPLLLGASAQEERGRQIYLKGVSPSGGEITAEMGEGVDVPASAVPCAGCHGRDGRGRPEGGVSPSDVTWESLTRPYEVTRPDGRRHPAYDERLLKRAITLGFDPAGNRLHAAMPRFRMSQEDMADLIAWLKQMSRESDQGVRADAVRIGAVLPPAGPLTPMARAVRSALAARFEEANRGGGIWGRRVELRELELSGPPAGWPDQVKGFLEKEEVFAVTGGFVAGADRELPALFAERETPLLGPFTLHPNQGNRQVFFLLSGLEEQVRALVRSAPQVRHPIVLAPEGADLDAAVRAGTWEAVRYPRSGLEPQGLARRLAGQGTDAVLFLGSGPEGLALLRAADGLGWHPLLLATASAADGSLLSAPPAFDGRIFVAVPALPGIPEAYRRLADLHGLPPEHLSAQLSALAAAELLLAGLERSGRDLTRDRLIERLEELRGFDTGFVPPVTYGPARRLGSRGAYILKADLKRRSLAPDPGWIEAD